MIKCPQCGSKQLYRNGIRYLRKGIQKQRFLCRDCGYRFSEKSYKECQTIGKHQICAIKVKNLINATEIKTVAGTSPKTDQDFKGKIIYFSLWLLKQGYAESTIEGKVKLIKRLIRLGANLFDPETIKLIIAKQQWCPGRKENAVHAYSSFLQMVGGKWNPPRYKRIRKIPWIPTETEVDQLIAGCSNKMSIFLQLLKETGMRPGEAWQLKWIDLDYNNKTVRVTPEKGSNPRILPITNRLVAMLNTLPHKADCIFNNGFLKHFIESFRRQRIRIALKLENPRLKQITFKTLRHFKATMEYHKTKDILHVMRILGHKNINNTLVYTHLVNFKDDEYISKMAKTSSEATKLIDAGFDYVCTAPDNLMIFKKRK